MIEPHGLVIYNGSSGVVLSSEAEPYVFWGKASSAQSLGNNIYKLTITAPEMPLVFSYVPLNYACGVIQVVDQGGTYDFYCIATYSPILYCFVPARYINTPCPWGVALYDRAGTQTYNSCKPNLVIKAAAALSASISSMTFADCAKPMFCWTPTAAKVDEVVESKTYTTYYNELVYECTRVHTSGYEWQYVCNYERVCGFIYGNYECSYQNVCSWEYVFVINSEYVCEWVYYSVYCAATWNNHTWSAHRPAIKLISATQAQTGWVQHASGVYSTDYASSCIAPRKVDGYFVSGFHTGGIAADYDNINTCPYKNAIVGNSANYCFVSDGALYD